MQKQYVVVLLALLALTPGCGGKKKKSKHHKSPKSEVFTEIDIPVANDTSIRSFFDDEVGEFSLADDTKDKTAPTSLAQQDEFSWVEEPANKDQGQFKIVYFNFDDYTLRQDQEAALAYDIEQVKKVVAERADSEHPTIVIDGHACHSAGSHVYNLALSEKRAKVLADRFIAAGVPSECVKIVGRGMEVPALVDGKPVDGDREQQWPNRRDEIRILYS